jgi:hypothetical protein
VGGDLKMTETYQTKTAMLCGGLALFLAAASAPAASPTSTPSSTVTPFPTATPIFTPRDTPAVTPLPSPPPCGLAIQQPATFSLGQPNLNSSAVVAASATSLYSPNSIASDGAMLWVADGTNHRVLGYPVPGLGQGAAATVVLGQLNMVQTSGSGAYPIPDPRGVATDGSHLLVADAGLRKILIFDYPISNGMSPSVILGQSASPPTYVLSDYIRVTVADGRVFVVDGGNNRVLVWNQFPTVNGQMPDLVLGQKDFVSTAANQGGSPANTTMNQPFGIYAFNGKLLVGDTSNNRVLLWNSLPIVNDQPADLVLGKATFSAPAGGGLSAINAGDADGVYFDGNNIYYGDGSRLLGLPWPAADGASAQLVLGQPNFAASGDATVNAQSMGWGVGIVEANGYIFVASQAENRILAYGCAGEQATFTVSPSSTRSPSFTRSPTATRTATASPSPTRTLSASPTGSFTGSPTATPTATKTFTATGSPTQTPTASPTGTFSASPTATGTPSATGTATATVTQSFTVSPTATFSASPTATGSPSATGTATATPTQSFTASPTGTFSASPTTTGTSSATGTATATATQSFTVPPTATFSASPTATGTPSETRSFTASPAASSSPTSTAAATPSASGTQSSTASPTGTFSASPTATGSPSASGTATASVTPSFTASATSIFSAGPTATESPSASGTATASATQSFTASPTSTFSASPTATGSPSASGTATASATPSFTASATSTFSAGPTATGSPSASGTATASATPSFTALSTATFSATATGTPSESGTATASPTRTFTASPTGTMTGVLTPSFTGTPMVTVTASLTATQTATNVATPSPAVTSTACALSMGQNATFSLGQANLSSSIYGSAATGQTLAGPQGIASDGTMLWVADGGAKRVLGYPLAGLAQDSPATVVLGQSSFTASGAGAPGNSIGSPSGVASDGTYVVVADATDNRVLVYLNPSGAGSLPTYVLGQPNLSSTAVNQGSSAPGSATLNFPTGVAIAGGRLYVADSSNNRVMVWAFPPLSSGASAELVLGQPNFTSNAPNQGLLSPNAATLYVPVAVTAGNGRVFVADYDNDRVLGWGVTTGLYPALMDQGADAVVGAFGFNSPGTNVTTASGLAAPRSVYYDGSQLYCGDMQSRLLVFPTVPPNGAAATVALGQSSLTTNNYSGVNSGSLTEVWGITVANGTVFASSDTENRVLAYTCGGGTSVTPALSQTTSSSSTPTPTASQTPTPVCPSLGIINTIAGNGAMGYSGDGGPGNLAEIQRAQNIASDASGNVYIADTGNARIRRLDAVTGIISTVAGNGTVGYSGDGASATLAEIGNAQDVVVDAAGDIYIADTTNNCVRKVDTSNIITTVAGTGTAGFSGDSGPATSAKLNDPIWVAVDGLGNLYIADTLNFRIRKVSGGIISTVAGNGTYGYSGDAGPAGSAEIGEDAIAVDAAGLNLYLAGEGRVRKVSGGIISTIAGNGTAADTGDSGPASSAEVDTWGVSVDTLGNLFLVDQYEIRKIASGSSIITTVAGNGTVGFSGDGGPAVLAQLNEDVGVSVDGDGSIYIADKSNNRIRKVNGCLPAVPTPAPLLRPPAKNPVLSENKALGTQTLIVYPNPSHGGGTALFKTPAEGRVTLRIYNLSGDLVRSQELGDLSPGIHQQALAVEGLASGLYLVALESSGSGAQVLGVFKWAILK